MISVLVVLLDSAIVFTFVISLIRLNLNQKHTIEDFESTWIKIDDFTLKLPFLVEGRDFMLIRAMLTSSFEAELAKELELAKFAPD